jgi:hypothetical protein
MTGQGRFSYFIANQTRINISRFRADLQLSASTGRYDQHTELLPRTRGDIALPN